MGNFNLNLGFLKNSLDYWQLIDLIQSLDSPLNKRVRLKSEFAIWESGKYPADDIFRDLGLLNCFMIVNHPFEENLLMRRFQQFFPESIFYPNSVLVFKKLDQLRQLFCNPSFWHFPDPN